MSLLEHPGDEQLIDLAAGLVGAESEPALLHHLASCPECERRFRRTCREAELARLRFPAHRRRGAWWAVSAAAAAVLLGALVLGLFWSRSPALDPARYWFPLGKDTVNLRAGAVDPQEAVLEEAAQAYRRHDPVTMVALLEGRQLPEAHDPLKIALADALVKTGRPAQALALLDELRIDSIPQPDRDRARWIRCAALGAAGRSEEARALLAELASRPGEFAQAAERLSRLSLQGSPTSTKPAQ